MYVLDSKGQEPFNFEFDGETYSIPSRQGLPMPVFRSIQKAISKADDKEEALFDEIMKVFDAYIPEVMEKITLGQAMELFKAYSMMDDGASLGESSASSD